VQNTVISASIYTTIHLWFVYTFIKILFEHSEFECFKCPSKY